MPCQWKASRRLMRGARHRCPGIGLNLPSRQPSPHLQRLGRREPLTSCAAEMPGWFLPLMTRPTRPRLRAWPLSRARSKRLLRKAGTVTNHPVAARAMSEAGKADYLVTGDKGGFTRPPSPPSHVDGFTSAHGMSIFGAADCNLSSKRALMATSSG